MKKAFYIKFKDIDGIRYAMPYLFTSLKEASTYGEYSYRTDPEIENYEIHTLFKLEDTEWYKL